jgi:polyferredoxin
MRGRGVKRKLIQAAATVLCNGNLVGFARGTVYDGPLKRICVPGLNCYACPGALGSCPLGALQNAFADPARRVSLYAVGALALIGLTLGRWVCGFLCPFGLLQEVLGAGRRVTWRLPRFFTFVKYGVLGLLVIALPLLATDAFGFGAPWFCKYICPAGTLTGALPLLLANAPLRPLLGGVFWLKLAVALGVVLALRRSYRFFCKALCPLGALYGLCNKLSLYTLGLDRGKCQDCGACARGCPMEVDPRQAPNSPECIRCGRCAEICPANAIALGFTKTIKTKRGNCHEKT